MAHTLKIVIDAKERVTRVVIYAAQLDEEVQDLADRLECTDEPERTQKSNRAKRMLGYRDEEVILLDFDEIVCFFAQGQTVQARTRYGIVRIKHRLYELEEMLEGSAFIRISNSEIVNFKHVRSFEFSFGGTLSLKTMDNERSYVSRRYTICIAIPYTVTAAVCGWYGPDEYLVVSVAASIGIFVILYILIWLGFWLYWRNWVKRANARLG